MLENLHLLCPNFHGHTMIPFTCVKHTHSSKNEFSIDKQNMITKEKNVFVSLEMKRTYRQRDGLS